MEKIISSYLEYKFKLYPKYPSMIAKRRMELEYVEEVDESLSTSKSNYGNHEEDKRIRILDDLKINNYYRIYKGVEKTLYELNPEKRKLIPAAAVYAVRVNFNDDIYAGMMNIGIRPTMNNGPVS